MVTKENRSASEETKVAKFQTKISENKRPLALKTLTNNHRSTQLRYLNTWDNNPMKLYAMVDVNDDQKLLMNQCHHPGKIEFDKSWWTRPWNLRNDSILNQIVDGNVMDEDYNVLNEIDKSNWSVPAPLSTLAIHLVCFCLFLTEEA